MKSIGKNVFILVSIFSFVFLTLYSPSMATAAKAEKKPKPAKVDVEQAWAGKPNAIFDANKMSDMSDFDPDNIGHAGNR